MTTDTDTDTERFGGVTVFFGAASGQQRSALRRLEPEAVMISHAGDTNTPWDGDYELFVDCGGYHHMMTGGGDYADSDADYLAYIDEHRPDWFGLRDYPCEPDLLTALGRSVGDQQKRTLSRHIDLLDMLDESGSEIRDRAVAVLQGWTVDQYLEHFEMLRDHDCLTDRIAIGSVCRRHQDREIADIILSIREAVPSDIELHAFGVKGDVLQYREVLDAVASVDSAAYDYEPSRFDSARDTDGTYRWRDAARGYLNWRHDLLQKVGTVSLTETHPQQATFDSFDPSADDHEHEHDHEHRRGPALETPTPDHD